MSCKDCIHYEVCCGWTSKEAIDSTDEAVENGICHECDYFKPTTDVVEVRHGEWYTDNCATLSGGLNWYSHSCSDCNYTYKTVVPIGYDFCPNCGAKMDGERKEK